jgi:hypothetical protein
MTDFMCPLSKPETLVRRSSAPDEVKQAAVTLYGFGLSLNAVGCLLGRCAQSVMR